MKIETTKTRRETGKNFRRRFARINADKTKNEKELNVALSGQVLFLVFISVYLRLCVGLSHSLR